MIRKVITPHRALFAALLAAVMLAPVQAAADGGYTAARYPVVLVHGLFGFDNIGPVQYFYGIPSALRADGARVFVAQVAASNSTEVRGEQLLKQVKEIIATTGKPKVNLIGHSHGGPTIRYVAGVRPDLVASVTSVGGVNKGSPVADLMLDLQKTSPVAGTLLARVTDAFSGLIDLLSGGGYEQDSTAAMRSLSTEGSRKFNQQFPAAVPEDCGDGQHVVNGVRYYSWIGTSPLTNPADPSDYFLGLTALAFDGPTDGLVGQCSGHLGWVIRDDYRQNHLDEVNQTVGLTAPFEQSPVELYRQQVNRLKQVGL